MQTVRRMLLYGGVALVNVLSTVMPVWPMRYELLAGWVPWQIIQGAEFTTLALGICILILSAPVAGGHLRAAYLLMLCAGLAAMANILKGLDIEEAAVNAALLLILWRSRDQFDDIPLRYTAVDAARLGLALLVFLWTYNLVGEALLSTLRSVVDRVADAVPKLDRFVHILTAKLQLEHIWFRESQLILPGFLLLTFLIYSWRAVIPARASSNDSDDLYVRFGRASRNSLAYLAQRSDVLRFVDSQAAGAITYRQIGRIAIQIGAILAPPDRREHVYRAFLAFCRTQRLIPCAAAITEEECEAVRACGMHTINIGTEAVVDLTEFSVDLLGKKMRWAQRSLTKRGYSVSVLGAAIVPRGMLLALDRIDQEWRARRGGLTHGCCMTLGRFPTPGDDHCLVAVASDASGSPEAYLTLLPGGEGYYSLDLTRRLHSAPNAIMEYLLLEVLGELKKRGVSKVSLNFSTFSSLASVRGLSRLVKAFGNILQLQSLEAFNAKFKPHWEPRCLALPSWYYLPTVPYRYIPGPTF